MLQHREANARAQRTFEHVDIAGELERCCDELAFEEAQAAVQQRALPAKARRLRREAERLGDLAVDAMDVKAAVGHLRTLGAGELQQRGNSARAQVVIVVEVQQPATACPARGLVARHGARDKPVPVAVGVPGDALGQVGVMHARVAERRYSLGDLWRSRIADDEQLQIAVRLREQ